MVGNASLLKFILIGMGNRSDLLIQAGWYVKKDILHVIRLLQGIQINYERKNSNERIRYYKIPPPDNWKGWDDYIENVYPKNKIKQN